MPVCEIGSALESVPAKALRYSHISVGGFQSRIRTVFLKYRVFVRHVAAGPSLVVARLARAIQYPLCLYFVSPNFDRKIRRLLGPLVEPGDDGKGRPRIPLNNDEPLAKICEPHKDRVASPATPHRTGPAAPAPVSATN